MYLDYTDSGIKTLRRSSLILFIISILGALVLIPTWISEKPFHEGVIIHWEMIVLSFSLIVSAFFMYGLGYSIATIAENALWEKQIKKMREDD